MRVSKSNKREKPRQTASLAKVFAIPQGSVRYVCILTSIVAGLAMPRESADRPVASEPGSARRPRVHSDLDVNAIRTVIITWWVSSWRNTEKGSFS